MSRSLSIAALMLCACDPQPALGFDAASATTAEATMAAVLLDADLPTALATSTPTERVDFDDAAVVAFRRAPMSAWPDVTISGFMKIARPDVNGIQKVDYTVELAHGQARGWLEGTGFCSSVEGEPSGCRLRSAQAELADANRPWVAVNAATRSVRTDRDGSLIASVGGGFR